MSGNPSSLNNPSAEGHSNNHTTPPNHSNTAYAEDVFNIRTIRELMSPPYEPIIRHTWLLYNCSQPQMRGWPAAAAGMTFTNYVLNSLVQAGCFLPAENAPVDLIEEWRAVYRYFIDVSYAMRPYLQTYWPYSALRLEAAFALQSAAWLRSELAPQLRFGNQQRHHPFPIHPGLFLSPFFPPLPQSSRQPPRPPAPSPLPPLPLSTRGTDWSIQSLLSLNHTIKDESPAAESQVAPFTHRSTDPPSDCFIESAPEHLTPFQLTDRSVEPFPATSANSTPTRSYEPSTSRYFQPTAAPSFERAGENSVGGSRRSRTECSNGRTEDRTSGPPPKRSYKPPVTRSNQSSARSTERRAGRGSRSLRSATAPKTYPAPYFRPSIGSGYSHASASGFVPPAANGYQQSTTHSFLLPLTPPIDLRSTFKNEDSLVASSEPPISSAFKPPAIRDFERSTLHSLNLPGRCSEPPPAHIPMKWPIPDHSPTPRPVYTIKPPSTPLPSPLPMPPSLPMPPPLPMSSPLPSSLPMPPPLPMSSPLLSSLPMPPPLPMSSPLLSSLPMPPPLPMSSYLPPSLPMPPPLPMSSPLPSSLPMPPPLPMSSPLPPSLPKPPPLPSSLPMPPPLPMPTHTLSSVYRSAHMPMLRANQVQMATPPPEYMRLPRLEHIPLPPRRSSRGLTSCPLCGSELHTWEFCPLAVNHKCLRKYRRK